MVDNLQLIIEPNSQIKLNQVSGSTRTVGRVQFKLTIGNTSKLITAHVIQNFKYQLLIGLDSGSQFDVNVNMKTKVVSCNYTSTTLESTNDRAHEIAESTANKTHEATKEAKITQLRKQIEQEFSNMFAKDDNDCKGNQIPNQYHHIITTHNKPIYCKNRRRSPQLNETIRTITKGLKARDLIEDSNSPYGFQTTVVYKKDGTPRLCVDYRLLNEITVDDKFGLPNIKDIIDKMQGSKFFTSLDIAWGYWHVRMDPDSISKTAFNTDDGHYQWKVMPFGLKGAPSTFQRIIRSVLGDLSYKCCINYLDDIIIYSKTLNEHIEHIKMVLTKLNANNIKLRKEKCRFIQDEISYLGYIIKDDKVSLNPANIESVVNFPEPKDKKQVQQFLGLASFCRNVISNYTEKAFPLTKLTRKSETFIFEEKQRQAFNSLKQSLVTAPLLTIYKPELPCELYTDGSRVGIGSILIQRDIKTQKPLIIAYYSKRLSKEQENWPVCDIEGLAVVESIEHFDCYLRSLPFKVFTDNMALHWIAKSDKLKGRLHRWFLRIQTYSFTIYYRKGSAQQHVDALSRAPFAPATDALDVDRTSGVIVDTRKHQEATMSLQPKSSFTSLTIDEIKEWQSTEDFLNYKNTFIQNGVKMIKVRGQVRILVSPHLAKRIFQIYHDDLGHPGINKTLNMISQTYFWFNMKQDLRQYILSCHTCQRVKQSPALGELQLMPVPEKPLQLLSMDTIVMGSVATNSAAKYIQVIIDQHSRYVWAFATKTNTTDAIKTSLAKIIETVGPPQQVLTDNGTNFTSKAFKSFCESHKIKQSFSSTYHPQTNGMVERMNKTIKEKLTMATLENPKLKWSSLLDLIITNYNNTIHDTTGYTPKFLLFGIQDGHPSITGKLDLEIARKESTDKTRRRQELNKHHYDQKHTKTTFKPGDKVLVILPHNHPSRNKLSPKADGPFIIIAQTGPVTYLIEMNEKQPYLTHVSRLVRYNERHEDIETIALAYHI